MFSIASVVAGEIGRRADIANFSNALPALEQTPDMALWSSQRTQAFLSARSLAIDDPAAILRVPSLHLTVPVYPSATELHLNQGVGVIEGRLCPIGAATWAWLGIETDSFVC